MASYAATCSCGDNTCPGCDEQSEQDWVMERDEMRHAHRTNRLMNLIEAVEERIECMDEDDRRLPELIERYTNLTRALLNHRRIG